MSTDPSGLVSFFWPSRGGYGYRLETSPDLASDTWQPLATFFGNGNTISVPVAQVAPPGQQGGQNPPPGPTNTLKSAHFTLRTFPGLNQTLVAWNQPEQTGLSQALIAADFSNIVNLPLFFGKFTDAPNTTDYHLSFLIVGGTFDLSFNNLPALNVDETERLGWFTDRLGEVKLAMEDAQANGRATNGVPATGAGGGGPGARLFFRVVEMYQDADNDGILDHHEWGVTGGDPWLVDSDFDGYPDAEEFAAGSDPHDPNSTPANTTNGPPGSELPADEDEDGDTIPNALDADPLDINVDWERRSFPEFAVLPIANSSDLAPAAVNNRGEVVLNGPGEDGATVAYHWKPGAASPLALKLGSSAEFPLAIGAELFRGLDANGNPETESVTLMLRGARARAINDEGVIVGEGEFASDFGYPYYSDRVSVALRWDNAEAAPALVHPGKAAIGQWGDLLLVSSADHLNERGTILGTAAYAVPYPNAQPPFVPRGVRNLWEGAGSGAGQSLFDPASEPELHPVFTSLHREKTALTGGADGAGYWERWQPRPDHRFPGAGHATIAVGTMPNTREAIAGDLRLMLLTEDGRWEPALRTYTGGFALTEDGTVWFTDNGDRSLWHPLEKTTLTAITGPQGYDINEIVDVTNTGIAAAVSDNGNVVLVPLDFSVFPPEPTEEEIAEAGEDDWEIRSFQITADEPSIYIQAFFQAQGIDAEGEPAMVAVEDDSVIAWEIDPSSSAGGTLDATESMTEGGLASVLLTVSPTQRGKFKVKATVKTLIARFGDPSGEPVTLTKPTGFLKANSQFIEVLPGIPSQITVTREREDGPTTSLPADGKSEMTVRAVITDQHGNPAARGTRVYWHLKGSGGILDAHEIIAEEDGSVTATILAGNVPGNQMLTIEAEGKKHVETIVNAPVVFSQFAAAPSALDMASGGLATVTAQFQDVADGADIRWSTSKGRLLETAKTVEGGSATAILQATETTVGDAIVTATVGGTSRSLRVPFTTSAPISIGVEHPVLAGDAVANGTEAIPSLIGPDEQVPYFASTKVNVTAPTLAGQWVTLSATGAEPALVFPFDALNGNQSLDTSELVAATFGGATVATPPSPVHEGAGAAVFAGGGDQVTIPNHASLQPDPGFDLALWIRPDVLGGTLATKAGQYALALNAQGLLVFTFGTGGTAVSVTSEEPIPTGQWNWVKIERQAERIYLTVNQDVRSMPAPQASPAGTAPLVLGTGFEGRIDALAINSTGGAPGAAVVQFQGGNQKQLDAQGKAEFTLKTTGQAPANPGGKSVEIKAQVGTTEVKAKDAVQVVPKRDLAIILSIAGHSSFIGSVGETTFTEKDIENNVASLCRAKMRSHQQSSAIPSTLGGVAGEKAEVGYRIAIMMEEYSDLAGDIHPLMKISAEAGTAGSSQPLPPEVAEVLNLQWMEVMMAAAERPTDQSFNDFVQERYRELVEGLKALSAGDIDGFMRLAGALDGDESFEDAAHVGEQLGKETLDRWAREAGDVAIVGGALQKSLHWINNDMRDSVRETRDDLVAKIGEWSNDSEDFLRKATKFLLDRKFIDPETASGIGFVAGVLEQAEELIAAGLSVDEVATMLAQIRALIVDAIAADDPDARTEARNQLKLLASQPLAQVSEIPAHTSQFQEEIASHWNQGNHFDAGRTSASALGAVFFAKNLKDMLLKSGERVMRKARTYSTGRREAYIRNNDQHWIKEIGSRGESWALKRLKKNVKAVDVFPIQHAGNGHGIDLVVVTKDRRIIFVEVKGSAGETVGKPKLTGPAGQLGMREFTRQRIDQAIGDSTPMTGVTQQTIDRANAIKELLQDKSIPVTGFAIQVDWALSWFPRGRAHDWDEGVGDLVPGLP